MHPILFSFEVFGKEFTVYSYGFFIVLGAILAVIYLARQARKEFNVPFDTINNLFLLLLASAFIGGKVFLFFENPPYYRENPADLFSGRGFVFYGSLLFCIPVMLWYFRKNKLPVLPMLDIMAIVTVIVHGFGRIGCFMAGCCYGKETHGWLGVIFSDPACFARPLDTPLHPTQLYSAFMIAAIGLTLVMVKRRKMFPGQVFLLYLILYGIGRSVVEIFRGDESRGYVIEGILSHSQFISLLVIAAAVYFYRRNYINVRKTSKTS
ncbi:prolipoprotein diacylglyceryl transferase [Fulvivirga sedimenti]|uniref:Phosphatidylglycerol--prolipoprotein diacylglyceryl transferase n=1 Tax=Fulvivirga sedimenti TaxID=2879465 RepID=A0A9X1HUA8_9BACT|nr:prolipoprotein diacylglyceryl transferase [Fulvivirga sedimenti]MCA6074848.1 prolipoprotein diacylglyceryl transferase [Fulvivirga sedimenti]MCA6076025.1 prolipoprotein diacylglyceryl transferase [Fulvivirga sedimenti]MCA6077153.1 prolipoprotein diacylglyceryl transferase [Fulvivirga sedimenti]